MGRKFKASWSYAILATVSLFSFLLSSDYDLFEIIYQFSRAHEAWQLDEFFLLLFNMVPALTIALVVRTMQLKRELIRRKKAEQNAKSIARHDPLTGLGNRRAFQDHLAALSAELVSLEDAPLTTMLIDLDRFKPVNDLHGHAVGDAVLVAVAERLVEVMEPGDFPARLGGDEFAVVLARGSNPERAERVARRIVKTLSEPIKHGDIHIMIGASVGLSRVARVDAPAIALQHADQALYAAKRNGRNGLAWYDAELDAAATERAAIEAELRVAIAREQIIPHFQPIVEIDSNRIKGFEVLARWHHAERGNIPPGLFIEIAEDCGLVAPLGWSILRQSCQIAKDWDPNLVLSVNISPQQFQDGSLVATLKGILRKTGFDPKRLEIEITENAVIADFNVAEEAIRKLQALGVSIALDDFGTGFSSLSNLRRLPFDRLKIDRSFVTNITKDPSNQKIVSGIMALAKGLQLSVTAEGIETDEDLGFLKNLDCPMGQGFLFDKPMDSQQVAWMLETKWANAIAPRKTIDPQPEVTVQSKSA